MLSELIDFKSDLESNPVGSAFRWQSLSRVAGCHLCDSGLHRGSALRRPWLVLSGPRPYILGHREPHSFSSSSSSSSRGVSRLSDRRGRFNSSSLLVFVRDWPYRNNSIGVSHDSGSLAGCRRAAAELLRLPLLPLLLLVVMMKKENAVKER